MALSVSALSGCRGSSQAPPPIDHQDGPKAAAVAVPVTAKQVGGGREHTCALLSDGGVTCWGNGGEGRLGSGSTSNIGDDEPAASGPRVDLGGPALSIAVGGRHACALLDTGGVRCWGLGADGQLGYGNTNSVGDDETPAKAGDVDVGGPVVALAAGSAHTCALLKDGVVRCWGESGEGTLGNGSGPNVGDDEAPGSTPVVKFATPVVGIAAAAGRTCALLASGQVQCWGAMRGATVDRYARATDFAPVDLGFEATALFAGPAAGSFCATSKDRRLRCWGDLPQPTLPAAGNLSHQDGNEVGIHPSNRDGVTTPNVAGDLPVTADITDLALTAGFGCYLAAGHVRCWGNGERGVLGSSQDEVLLQDAVRVELGEPATDIAIGNFHTCAVLASGRVKCWGLGNKGQLGYGNTDTVGDTRPLSAVGYSL